MFYIKKHINKNWVFLAHRFRGARQGGPRRTSDASVIGGRKHVQNCYDLINLLFCFIWIYMDLYGFIWIYDGFMMLHIMFWFWGSNHSNLILLYLMKTNLIEYWICSFWVRTWGVVNIRGRDSHGFIAIMFGDHQNKPPLDPLEQPDWTNAMNIWD